MHVDFYAQGNITEVIAFPFRINMFYSLLLNLLFFKRTIAIYMKKETLLSRQKKKSLKVLVKQTEHLP